jgi:DNA-binding transcriptional LysR family regulator
MNLRHLKLYCDVFESRSFSKGAAINAVTQAAASQIVRQLERQLNVSLVDRTKRPLSTTPAGQVCYQCFREILDRLSALQRQSQLISALAGEVHVAAIYSAGLYAMNRSMQDFMTRYPQCKVRLEFLPPIKVYQSVRAGDADLGIVSYPKPSRDLDVTTLCNEPMVVVCHPTHRLAHVRQASMMQLDGESFVGFERTLPIRRDIDRYLRKRKVSVDMRMEFDNIETVKQAVEINAGISILPEPTVRTAIERGTMALVPVALVDLRRPLGIVRRRRKALPPCVSSFIQLLAANEGVN